MLGVRVSFVSTMVLFLLCAFAAAPESATAQTAASSAAPPTLTLYERLGGAYPIAVVVDDFIERLFVDEALNANPAIKEARGRVPAAGLKFHVTTLVCQATGGPCKYVGRSMKDAHAQLHITEKEWQAMLADLRTTLDKFRVGRSEQAELVAIVESTKPDIVLVSAAR